MSKLQGDMAYAQKELDKKKAEHKFSSDRLEKYKNEKNEARINLADFQIEMEDLLKL